VTKSVWRVMTINTHTHTHTHTHKPLSSKPTFFYIKCHIIRLFLMPLTVQNNFSICSQTWLKNFVTVTWKSHKPTRSDTYQTYQTISEKLQMCIAISGKPIKCDLKPRQTRIVYIHGSYFGHPPTSQIKLSQHFRGWIWPEMTKISSF
jgi:hypothetical protein